MPEGSQGPTNAQFNLQGAQGRGRFPGQKPNPPPRGDGSSSDEKPDGMKPGTPGEKSQRKPDGANSELEPPKEWKRNTTTGDTNDAPIDLDGTDDADPQPKPQDPQAKLENPPQQPKILQRLERYPGYMLGDEALDALLKRFPTDIEMFCDLVGKMDPHKTPELQLPTAQRMDKIMQADIDSLFVDDLACRAKVVLPKKAIRSSIAKAGRHRHMN